MYKGETSRNAFCRGEEHLDYLERPLTGAALGRYIIGFMPEKNAVQGDLLEEELETREREGTEPEFERPERFLGHMFRSLSIDTAEAAPVEAAAVAGAPALASLPSNHNPFLGEPGPGNSGNGNFGGAIPRRNSGYVRNVNQGPGTLYNWQATKTTVNERFAFMFNNEILADVHFKVNECLF